MLYSFNSVAITLILFICMVLFNELAFKVGLYIQKSTVDETKTLTGSVQASVLGLLALLLGFTFSMSMQRYDDRSEALIAEVSAIETVALHTRALPETQGTNLRHLLGKYIQLRIDMSQIDLTRNDERTAYHDKINNLQEELWLLAIPTTADPSNSRMTVLNNAMIDMFNAQKRRNALLQMYVPEVVLMLLFLVFVSAGGILGYSAGLSGSRILAPTMLVSLLISLIVFIIIDLDRPRRGLIQVDQSSLVYLGSRYAT